MLLPFGTSSMNISNANAIAEDKNYADQYENYATDMSNDNHYKSQGSDFIKKVKCNNINVNVNGFNGATLPTGLSGLATDDEAQAADEGEVGTNSFGSDSGSDVGRPSGSDSDSRFVCINNNDFAVIGGEEPIPPTPPTPQTASLTVNKEVFGCTNFSDLSMNCRDLQNNSPWISCNAASISETRACLSLNVNLFDIEVWDSQNNPVVEAFEGSTAGTTIPHLQPGTYTINEIESTTSNRDQLGDFSTDCAAAAVGFPDGGTFRNTNPSPPSIYDLDYTICFEYEDQPGNAQGDDCNTITLAAGEHKTCTVKNYIRAVVAFD